jgi:hypothetical protein
VSFSAILCRASGVLRGFIVPNWIIATCSSLLGSLSCRGLVVGVCC